MHELGLGFRVYGLGFRYWALGGQGYGIRISGFFSEYLIRLSVGLGLGV